ncbi:MAG: CerR family C-terminal domain-containing protein, partial [Planctomycetota bacterium]
IGYHFGSKRALYDATVQRFQPEAIADYFPEIPDPSDMTREQAVKLFREFVATFVSIKARVGENPHVAMSYIEGEGAHGGAPNPSFYKKVIVPGHSALRRLIEAIRPDIHDDLVLETLTFNVIGQCLMLRIGRGILLKRLGLRTLSPEVTETIAHSITEVAIRGLEDAEF